MTSLYVCIQYHESMMLFYSESCGMELRLIGEAVEPHVVLEPDTDRMECGHTYAGDVCTRTFKLRNTCSLAVKYQIRQQRKWTEKEEIFSESTIFLNISGKILIFIGAANYSGKPVFDCIPFRGRIEPGKLHMELAIIITGSFFLPQMVPRN